MNISNVNFTFGYQQVVRTLNVNVVETQVTLNVMSLNSSFLSFSLGALTQYINYLLLARYVAALGLIQASYQNVSISFRSSLLSISKTHKLADDKFGVGRGMGADRKSNLARSPEVVIALHQILKSKRNLSMEKIKEILKKEYGIDAEVTKVNGRKALRFANGDYIVDSNGNNVLDTGDYNFKGAIKELSKRYGVDINKLSPDEIKQLVERIKINKMFGDSNLMAQLYQTDFQMSYGTAMLTAPQIMWLFAQAYQLAV